MKEIIIIGNGKLAQSFFKHFRDYSAIPLKRYQTGISSDCQDNNERIYIHLGSGRQFQEALEHGSSYIQAATEKNFPLAPPSQNRIRYIDAPNLDLKIIKLFHWLKAADKLFKDESISITESHQADKQSQPGTAIQFCDILGIPKTQIVSIRDPEAQKKIGITNLEQHAYHKIQWGDEDSGITIEAKVEGSISYVKGLAKIVQCLSGLRTGTYNISDLVELGLI